MFPRFHQSLDRYLKDNRVLIIYGPRRAGKTTLLESYLSGSRKRYRYDSGDNIKVADILGSQDFDRILDYVADNELIAIDEAQQIPNIGMGLKIIVDQVPGIQVIATGSASFELAQQVGEPLTGRKRTIHLFPLAQMELRDGQTPYDLRCGLRETLIFGTYPEVLLAKTVRDKCELLDDLVSSYLLKDILALERVKGSAILLNLVKLLAFQVGQLVSHSELATQLQIDTKTVVRYIDLLEKGFVIHRLGGYSRNLRKEITRKSKYYFLDNGIRNAVIGRFGGLEDRDDQGPLWENFLFSERLKWASYRRWYGSRYFWRTYGGHEIDFVEEQDGQLKGYEAKWSDKKKIVPPKEWKTAYPAASYEVITPENYVDFVMEKESEKRARSDPWIV